MEIRSLEYNCSLPRLVNLLSDKNWECHINLYSIFDLLNHNQLVDYPSCSLKSNNFGGLSVYLLSLF